MCIIKQFLEFRKWKSINENIDFKNKIKNLKEQIAINKIDFANNLLDIINIQKNTYMQKVLEREITVEEANAGLYLLYSLRGFIK